MSKHVRPFLAFLTLAVAVLACAVPLPQFPPVGTPSGNATALPPASPDPNQVGTAVAATLTASVPGPVGGSPTPTGVGPSPSATAPTSGGPTGALPHTFYYLAPDSAGIAQVFRMETDGTTQHQVTSESVNISDYDVSLVDGSVAYVANNQLLY